MGKEYIADTLGSKISDGLTVGGGVSFAAAGVWLGEHINTVSIVVGIVTMIIPVGISYHFKKKRLKLDAFYKEKDELRKQADEIRKQADEARKKELHAAKLSRINSNAVFMSNHEDHS